MDGDADAEATALSEADTLVELLSEADTLAELLSVADTLAELLTLKVMLDVELGLTGEAVTLAELLELEVMLGVVLGLTAEGENVALREADGDLETELEGEGQFTDPMAEVRPKVQYLSVCVGEE